MARARPAANGARFPAVDELPRAIGMDQGPLGRRDRADYSEVVLLTSDHAVMGKRANPPLPRWLGWATAVVMTAATVGMLVTV